MIYHIQSFLNLMYPNICKEICHMSYVKVNNYVVYFLKNILALIILSKFICASGHNKLKLHNVCQTSRQFSFMFNSLKWFLFCFRFMQREWYLRYSSYRRYKPNSLYFLVNTVTCDLKKTSVVYWVHLCFCVNICVSREHLCCLWTSIGL